MFATTATEMATIADAYAGESKSASLNGVAAIASAALAGTTTMPAMRQTVAAIRQAGLDGVKVVVGGAPLTQTFASDIGADGFAADAATAVEVVRKLVAA